VESGRYIYQLYSLCFLVPQIFRRDKNNNDFLFQIIPLEFEDTSTNHYFNLACSLHITTSLSGTLSQNFSKLINSLGVNTVDWIRSLYNLEPLDNSSKLPSSRSHHLGVTHS
jgi:hypothetical protein